MHNAAHEGHTAIAQVLLQAGADANALINWDDGTPLIRAASAGHIETVRALLAGGAEVNANDRYERTALMIAKEKGHTEVVELLKAAGAKE